MLNNKTQNSFIAAITDQPLLVSQGSEATFSTYLQELALDPEFMECYERSATEVLAFNEDGFWDDEDPFIAAFRPYHVSEGTLTIPVSGVLLNKFSWHFGRRATGYAYIRRALERGLADPQVARIAFVHDSGGGEVAGNFELTEQIAAARSEKPMRAFAAEGAYSASYNLAAAAGQIIMTRSAGVGSVGVVVAHIEVSEMMKDMGIKVTFIHAGKFKVAGNAYEKLPDSEKARIQAKVDRTYGEFVSLVAANRGMSESAVRDTEALMYDSSEAIEVGFADRVGALDQEMAIFAEEAGEQEEEFMAIKPNTQNTAPAAPTGEGNAAPEASVITQGQMDSAVTTARTEGAAAERSRVNAILDSDEGKARPRAALAAALKTDLSADQASAFLASLPEEGAEEPQTPQTPQGSAAGGAFNEAMGQTGNPNVGAEPEAGTPAQGAVSTTDQMLGALSSAIGKPRNKQQPNH